MALCCGAEPRILETPHSIVMPADAANRCSNSIGRDYCCDEAVETSKLRPMATATATAEAVDVDVAVEALFEALEEVEDLGYRGNAGHWR